MIFLIRIDFINLGGKMKKIILTFFLNFVLLINVFANAGVNYNLQCEENGKLIPFNNEKILYYKKTTQNQFLARGHVLGTVIAVYHNPQHPSHSHFLIKIGPNLSSGNACDDDTLEVIYNKAFGEISQNDLKLGANVQACGDYITSNKKTARYPKSPACAIIHWVHKNFRSDHHPDGYLYVNGKLYGMQKPSN
jgi:hypothetical protein